MKFEFATAARIIFGAGAINQVGQEVKHIGRRALVVTGRNPQRADKLLTILSASGVGAATFTVAGEPEISTIENGVAFAKQEDCGLVIALGGGSVIDAGKAIAAMMTNEGGLMDYLEIIGKGKSLVNPTLPFFAIPTTAGTGAEVTRNAVLASPQHQVKVSLRSPLLLARVAVIDPELTYDLPPAFTASTGLDALTQLIEPYVCLRANPMTDGFCVEGIRRAARSLREAVFNGQNQSAREDMALASCSADSRWPTPGWAPSTDSPDRLAACSPRRTGPFAPPCCRMSWPRTSARSANANRTVTRCVVTTASPRCLPATRTPLADAGVEWVRELVAALPISKLGVYGLREEHVADIVAKAANASSMKANPIVLTPEELAQTLRLAL